MCHSGEFHLLLHPDLMTEHRSLRVNVILEFQGGMYVVELIDKFSTSFPLLITTCLEAVILSWIYGEWNI